MGAKMDPGKKFPGPLYFDIFNSSARIASGSNRINSINNFLFPLYQI
jgi:hypothetical protein